MTTSPQTPIPDTDGGEVSSPQQFVIDTIAAAVPQEDEAPVTMEERQAMVKDITGKATSLVQLLQDYQDQERELRDALLEFVVRDVSEQDRHMQCTRRILDAQRDCLNNAEYVQWALRHGKGEFSAESNALYGDDGGAEDAAVAVAARAAGASGEGGGNATARGAENDRALWPVAAGGYTGGGNGTRPHVLVGINRGLGEALAGWRSQSTNTNNVAGGSAHGTASLTAALTTLVRAYVESEGGGAARDTSRTSRDPLLTTPPSSSSSGVWCLNGIPLLALAGGSVALPPHLTASSSPSSKADLIAAAASSPHADAAVRSAASGKPEAVVHAWWCAAIDAAAAAAARARTASSAGTTTVDAVEALRRHFFGIEAATAMSAGASAPPASGGAGDDAAAAAGDAAATESGDEGVRADRIRAATVDSLLRHEWAPDTTMTTTPPTSSAPVEVDGATWESPDTLSLVPAALLKRALLVRALVVGGFLYGVEPLVPQAALLLELGFRGPREVLAACRAELARLDAAAPAGSLPRNRCLILALVPPHLTSASSSESDSMGALPTRILDLAPLGPATPMGLFNWRDICAAASQVKSFHATAATRRDGDDAGKPSEPFQAVFRGQAQRVVWDADADEEEEGSDADHQRDAAASASAQGANRGNGQAEDWDGFISVWVQGLRRRVVAPPRAEVRDGASASPTFLGAAVGKPDLTTSAVTATASRAAATGDARVSSRSGSGAPGAARSWAYAATLATVGIACTASVVAARFLRKG